jgi:hypothetical protein
VAADDALENACRIMELVRIERLGAMREAVSDRIRASDARGYGLD